MYSRDGVYARSVFSIHPNNSLKEGSILACVLVYILHSTLLLYLLFWYARRCESTYAPLGGAYMRASVGAHTSSYTLEGIETSLLLFCVSFHYFYSNPYVFSLRLGFFFFSTCQIG
jgi:hypothetical protein